MHVSLSNPNFFLRIPLNPSIISRDFFSHTKLPVALYSTSLASGNDVLIDSIPSFHKKKPLELKSYCCPKKTGGFPGFMELIKNYYGKIITYLACIR